MLFIAKRIYRGGELGKVSTSAVRIATIGVAVGIMIMVISLCVTSGFQSEIKSKVASLIGQVQIVNNQSLYRTQTHPIQITDSLRDRLLSIPEVERVQRFALCRGMLKTDNAFRGVLLRGVDADFDTTFISTHLIEGCMPSFGATSAPSDSIVLPARLARVLELCAGDRVYAYFFDENLRARRFYVSGIYETNMADFDSHMCYVDSRVAQKLSQWQSDQFQGAEIVLKKASDMHRITDTISSLFQPRFDAYGQFYAVCTVEDMFPQIFSWLTLLDTNVMAILILMICVACVTVVSGLLVIILERTRFIGVMKAMGATNGQLRHLFLYLSAMIVLRGLFWGNSIAFLLLFVQKFTGVLSLDPTVYYISQVPVSFPWLQLLTINVLTLLVSVLVLIVPTYVISRIHPARSIRFE